MLLFVPRFSSISFTILGTTTAGETALNTAPITAASIFLTFRRIGAKQRYPSISKQAGTNDIITAGLPTFFKSDKSSDNPALIRMIISAIWRNSEEIPSIDGSSRSSTYGPVMIPTASIPIIRGSLSCCTIAETERPTRKTIASDNNIIFPPDITKKLTTSA